MIDPACRSQEEEVAQKEGVVAVHNPSKNADHIPHLAGAGRREHLPGCCRHLIVGCKNNNRRVGRCGHLAAAGAGSCHSLPRCMRNKAPAPQK